MVRRLARVLTVLGALTLFVGLLAGLANRQLLDTDRFVAHADAVRRDPEVSRHLAVELGDRVIAARPDVVAARPLLEATLAGIIRSSAFAPAFRAMAAPLHQAAVGGDPDTIVLRLADVGAVLTAAARSASPQAARAIPADLDVRLARIGSGDLTGRAVTGVHAVRLLSWLLPCVALVCFAVALLLSRGRRLRAGHEVGQGVLAVGVVLAVAGLLATYLLDRLAPDTLGGAVVVAGWHDVAGAVRLTALLTAAAGYLVMVGTRLAEAGSLSAASLAVSVGSWLRGGQGQSPGAAVARAAVVVGVGVLLVLDPLTALSLLGIGAGIVLIVRGAVAGLVAVPGLLRGSSATARPVTTRAVTRRLAARPLAALRRSPALRTGLIAAIAAGLAICLTAGIVIWNAGGSTLGPLVSRGSSTACNGAVALCDRRYDQVAFPATHNSMAAADQPGWFLAEQPDGIIDQLDAGIRVFLIDTWYGQRTGREGVVANTDDTHEKAFAEARAEYGTDVLESALRLRNVLHLTPRGPRDVYLCHALCVLGSTRWEPLMVRVREWLDAHPREVVTFFVQDATSPASTAKVVEDAGLLPDVYTPTPQEAATRTWPTLRQMIDSGHRVVFLAEQQGGGTAVPWLLQGFDWVQDTPFDARRLSDFSCRHNRGAEGAPLFLVNHWLNQSLTRVSASKQANAAAVLGDRLATCRRERGMLPNYVAVDYYDNGDLFGQVDRLNGLG